MNKKQLERVVIYLRSVRAELKIDRVGTTQIVRNLSFLEKKVEDEIKELVWQEYQKEINK